MLQDVNRSARRSPTRADDTKANRERDKAKAPRGRSAQSGREGDRPVSEAPMSGFIVLWPFRSWETMPPNPKSQHQFHSRNATGIRFNDPLSLSAGHARGSRKKGSADEPFSRPRPESGAHPWEDHASKGRSPCCARVSRVLPQLYHQHVDLLWGSRKAQTSPRLLRSFHGKAGARLLPCAA